VKPVARNSFLFMMVVVVVVVLEDVSSFEL
jgi:hypothetical protein